MTTPNPYVPDPNASPMMPVQQSPYQQQGGVPAQGVPQPGTQQNWVEQPAVQGYPQGGYPGSGYGPVAPVKRRRSFKAAVILLVVGLLFAVSPFLAEGFIGLVPGNHGDGGDGLLWLAVIMLFYLTLLGIILILISVIIAIVIAVMNSSSKS